MLDCLSRLQDGFEVWKRGAVKAAGEKRGMQSRQEPPPQAYYAPIPAVGMGLQLGQSPDEMVILMRLYGFDVPFSVATERLVEVADGFAQTARTLSADPSRRN